MLFFFFKQKTAYEMRIRDWSSDVGSSDLPGVPSRRPHPKWRKEPEPETTAGGTMSVRNLDFLFKPRSVALIGASRRPRSVGAVLARNLFDGGFDGPVMPVNPPERSIESALRSADIHALPLTPAPAAVADETSDVWGRGVGFRVAPQV